MKGLIPWAGQAGLCPGTWCLYEGLPCAHEQLVEVQGGAAALPTQSEVVSRPQRKDFLLEPFVGLFLEQEQPNLNQKGLNRDRKVL